MVRSTMPFVRDYRPSDETGWLRCRVLAFLDTCYYDEYERVYICRRMQRQLVR